ncbi:HalOD1 output domain-containing protein [Natrarchaeobius oligotrophus]|uniref:HalOD1 output domain-containing protein n=1 Tax=Natrarchaeobius oligotrophus TaxID=3455743 RepID=UPI001A9E6922|nr:HalOD1 output domain-containing protein [Natrarchaeobius chitinivorans]
MNHAVTDLREGADDVSLAVVDAVARQRDVDPVSLPPLYEWIEPDALDALLAEDQRTDRNVRLEFEYAGHVVLVERTDELTVVVDGMATPAADSSGSADQAA